VEEHHPSELLLVMEGIEHRTTRIATPSTNGFVERTNHTLLDECFRVAGQQTWYITPAEITEPLERKEKFSTHDSQLEELADSYSVTRNSSPYQRRFG
jgi:transposase InsO family protein